MRKVIIIGGGAAGLSLAIGLKKNGLTVKLFEKRTILIPRLLFLGSKNATWLSWNFANPVEFLSLMLDKKEGVNFPNTTYTFVLFTLVILISFLNLFRSLA